MDGALNEGRKLRRASCSLFSSFSLRLLTFCIETFLGTEFDIGSNFFPLFEKGILSVLQTIGSYTFL